MISKKRLLLLLVIVFFMMTVAVLEAKNIMVSDLLENPDEYNGRVIQIQGEVVGDIMFRGENVWISLHDGETAIGVWAAKEDAEKIKHIGSYRSQGDIVLVEGVFNKGCIDHGGDFDLHAEIFKVISEGEVVKREISTTKVILAFVFFFHSFSSWGHRISLA